jgi:hypothetical protein
MAMSNQAWPVCAERHLHSASIAEFIEEIRRRIDEHNSWLKREPTMRAELFALEMALESLQRNLPQPEGPVLPPAT